MDTTPLSRASDIKLRYHPSPSLCLTGISERFDPYQHGCSTIALSWGLSKVQDVDEPDKLRELASWYRVFAERTGNPAIWEGRLRMAEDLDSEAERIERTLAITSVGPLER